MGESQSAGILDARSQRGVSKTIRTDSIPGAASGGNRYPCQCYWRYYHYYHYYHYQYYYHYYHLDIYV